jgi:hypothetical protein
LNHTTIPLKPLLITFLYLAFSLYAFAQNKPDSLKKMNFIYDVTLGAKVLTVHAFNSNSEIKMPASVAYLGQSFSYGRPYKYFISADIGIGMTIGSFFDSKKTFLSIVNYGLSLHKGFAVKNTFFISPFAGWQNSISYSTFSHFIYNKSNTRIMQNNLLVFGCDLSIPMYLLSKKQTDDHLSQVGIKLSYHMPLKAAYFKEGSEFFPNGIGSLSLGGFFIGAFCRF